MKVKSSFFIEESFKVGVGQPTTFWEETWLGGTPLALQYPTLCNIVFRKEDSVASILGASPLNTARLCWVKNGLSGSFWFLV